MELLVVLSCLSFNGHINWEVQEGDHYTYFMDFEEARDYYLKVAFGDAEK